MQRIIIENFGPIQHLDLEIKDLSLFIGEQATGKSTVAKLIYFFKSLRGDLIDYLYDSTPLEGDIVDSYWNKVTKKFSSIFWGLRLHSPSFKVMYQYGEKKYILNDHERLAFLDSELGIGALPYENEFHDIFKKISSFRSQYFSQDSALATSKEYREIESEKRQKLISIEKLINDFFCDDREVIFIPDGRATIAAIPIIFSSDDDTQNRNGKSYHLDHIKKEFILRIKRISPAFKNTISEMVEEKKVFGNLLLNEEVIDLTLKKINEILKGEYKVDASGEKIYFDEYKSIRLFTASSGQQEVLWILMQTFLLLLNREKVFLVIEEPEAHLSPEAQKSVVELITLLLKENGSQILITTHSPYILTAFNNLIYAGNVGKEHPEEVGKIIPPELWIDSEQVGAYKLRGGACEDLMDHETKLIRAEELDSVSQRINEAFDAILNLELQ